MSKFDLSIPIGVLALVLVIVLSCGKDENPVAPNNPPVIAEIEVRLGSVVLLPSQYVNIPAGQTLTITCVASDPDDDNLTVSWLANTGQFNRTDSDCVDWTAPDTSARAVLSAQVSDGDDTIAEGVSLGIIHVAVLTGGSVTPGSGNTGETFAYRVTFSDPTNRTPNSARVVVDGESHALTQISGEPSSGSIYSIEVQLAGGSHQFYFRFEDYRDSVITLPAGAYAVGPLVTAPGTLIDEDVIIIDEQDGLSLVSIDNSSYSLAFSGLPPDIGEGDMLLGAEPNGIIRSVLSAELSSGQITVQTAPAALADAIATGTFGTSFSFEIHPDGQVTTDGVYIEEGRLRLENVRLFSGSVGSATLTATIPQGQVSFEPTINHNVNLQDGKLVGLSATADGELAFNLDLVVETDAPMTIDDPIEIELARVQHSEVKYLDWFPVRVDYTLKFLAGFDFDSEIAGEAAFGFEGTATAGFGAEYQIDEWLEINEVTSGFADHPVLWDKYGTSLARVWVRPVLEFRVYSAMGPVLDARAYSDLGGYFTSSAICQWNLNAGIVGCFDIEGDVLERNLANHFTQLFHEEVILTESDCFPVTLSTEGYTFGGAGDEVAYSAVASAEGGSVLVGSTNSFGAGNLDVYLIKIDASGNRVWEKTFGGNNEDCGYEVVETGDGGFAVAGYTWSYGEGEGDLYLIRTDGAGNLLWQKTFGGAADDRGRCLVVTDDGGFAVAGRARSWSGGICDFYLIKTDANGNLEWQQTYGGSGSDRSYSLVAIADGGYALAGYTRSFGAAMKDVYLVRFDENGSFLWDQVFSLTAGDDCAYSLVQTADGGLVLTGFTPGDPFLLKTDASGNLLWQNLDLGGPGIDGTYSMTPTDDGGFLLTGFFSPGYYEPYDVFLIKTDGSGETEWYYRLGGSDQDIGYSVTGTAGEGYSVTGTTYSIGNGGADAYFITIDESEMVFR